VIEGAYYADEVIEAKGIEDHNQSTTKGCTHIAGVEV
jgi:hypothetical protein